MGTISPREFAQVVYPIVCGTSWGMIGWRTVCMSMMKMPVAVLMMFKMILRNKFTRTTSNNSNI